MTERLPPHCYLFLACKHFYRQGYLEIGKNILGIPPWKKCWETLFQMVDWSANCGGNGVTGWICSSQASKQIFDWVCATTS